MSCNRAEQPSNASGTPSVTVKVGRVESGRMDDFSEFVGTLQSRSSVTLQPQIEGQISQIFVRAGEQVKAGTTLLQVNPSRQQASVRSYIAVAASNRAELENARETLSSYEAERRSRISELKFQQQQYNRYAALKKQGAISQQILDQYRNSLDTAQASLDAANARFRAQQALHARAEKAIQQSQANVNEQTVQLQYYRIAAPFDGIVGDIPVKEGDYVNTATRLLTITQNRSLEVNVSIPTQRAAQLRQGMTVQLLDQQGKLIGNSKVFFISPHVNNQSQSVLIKALFDNTAGKLRADQLVQVRVIWNRHRSILIPTTAVSRVAGQNFVFVAQTNEKSQLIARRQPVKLGAIQENNYQVIEGLDVREKIAITGILKLSDGAVITPES